MKELGNAKQLKNQLIFWGILGAVVILAGVGFWYASSQEVESDLGTGNRNSSGNANTLANIAPVSTDGWKSYEVAEYGVSFRLPSDWIVKKEGIQSGSFQATPSIAEYIIEPAEPLAEEWMGPEYRQCYLIASSLGSKSIPEWIEGANLYVPAGDEGLNIQKQQEENINGISGILIEEGGPNAQQSYSFFFTVENMLLRYGFYGLRGAVPTDEEAKYGQFCNAVLNTLQLL